MKVIDIIKPALRSEHDLCINQVSKSAYTSKINDLVNKDKDCTNKYSELENCQVLQAQLKQIYSNRQKKYLKGVQEYKNSKNI